MYRCIEKAPVKLIPEYFGIPIIDQDKFLNPSLLPFCTVEAISEEAASSDLILKVRLKSALTEVVGRHPEVFASKMSGIWNTFKSNKTRREQSQIDRVLRKGVATIIFWKDGRKTVAVQRKGDEVWDAEKGFTFAYLKHGNFDYKQFCWDLKHFCVDEK